MASVTTDDILVALVYALNRAADAEQNLAQVMEQVADPDTGSNDASQS